MLRQGHYLIFLIISYYLICLKIFVWQKRKIWENWVSNSERKIEGKKKYTGMSREKKNKGGGKKNKGEEKLHFVGYKFEYAVLPGILFGPPAAVCEIFFSLKHYPENSNIQ